MENAQEVIYIEATPTWEGVMPILFAALESGTDEGKRIAREELMKLARKVDSINAAKNPASTETRPKA
jgi:hypothetical protein